MEKLFKRNYDATVKRGKITDKTTDLEFFNKLQEEFNEVYQEVAFGDIDEIGYMYHEIADCLLVCSNWLIHRGVSLTEILTKIAEKNEKRAS